MCETCPLHRPKSVHTYLSKSLSSVKTPPAGRFIIILLSVLYYSLLVIRRGAQLGIKRFVFRHRLHHLGDIVCRFFYWNVFKSFAVVGVSFVLQPVRNAVVSGVVARQRRLPRGASVAAGTSFAAASTTGASTAGSA